MIYLIIDLKIETGIDWGTTKTRNIHKVVYSCKLNISVMTFLREIRESYEKSPNLRPFASI